MRLAVLGPGGVGGFLAAALERSGNHVQVIAREPTADVIRRDGLRVESRVLDASFTARPRVATHLEEDVDVLFIATKATTLDAALDRVGVTPRCVVPLLNGIDHVERLRERFTRVAPATIRIEADRPEPGVVRQTSPATRMEFADDGIGPDDLASTLRAAGIPATSGGSEAQVLWSKLCRLNALACTTTAYDLPLGDIRAAHPEILRAAIEETVAVANRDGADIDAEAVAAELATAPAELSSSMRRDVAAGREPELDAIPGAVLRRAARHGLVCPTVDALAAHIRAMVDGAARRA